MGELTKKMSKAEARGRILRVHQRRRAEWEKDIFDTISRQAVNDIEEVEDNLFFNMIRDVQHDLLDRSAAGIAELERMLEP